LYSKKGFSLLETSVVLVIVSITITSIFTTDTLLKKARINLINSEFETLDTAKEFYLKDNLGTVDFSENNINFEKLIKQGYLEANKNFLPNTDKTKECYPSKLKSGCWYRSYNEQREYFILASLNSADVGVLDSNLCTQFLNKFNKKIKNVEIDKQNNVSCIDSSNINTNRKVLKIEVFK
jgi:prepilin-type N-terminal cleavage/methylation domain-containing protein